MSRKMLIDVEAGADEEVRYDYDLFVIGAGSGGVRASRTSANFGAKVAICELPFHPISSEVVGGVGGTCVIRGCVPKKILVYGAQFRGEFEDAKNFGWQINEEVGFDWKKLLNNKTQEITRLNGIYKRLLTNAGVSMIEGEGRIIDAHGVEVTAPDGTKHQYTAKHILIATGSRAQRVSIPGKELAITSDEALSLEESPKRAVILGGGYIAVEFASIWRGMGAEVDLFYRKDLPLRGFDDEMRAVVAKNLDGRGIKLHPGTTLSELTKTEDGIKVLTDKGNEYHADVVLFATDISTRTFDVKFTMKLTYKTPPYDDGDDIGVTEALPVDSTDSEIHLNTQWDGDCPWADWYSSEDPLKGFELITIWQQKTVKNSSEMAEIENSSSLDAEKWLLSPVLLPYLHDDSVRSHVGFASQLHNLVTAFDNCFDVEFIEDCVSAENLVSDNLKSLNAIPPPTVLDRLLKELFHDAVQISKYPKGEHRNSRAIKGAPLESLFGQFCLHALWFGTCNVRAITILWIEFVREIRWFWEESEALPGVLTDDGIDLSACLIHQKLQMLAICIKRKGKKHDLTGNTETEGVTDDNKMGESELEGDNSKSRLYSEKHVKSNTSDQSGSKDDIGNSNVEAVTNLASPVQQSSYRGMKGSCGTVGSMMLLHLHQKMRAPYTQDPPILTEDMHEERLNTIEAFGDSYSFSAMEKNILSSDMSAFKAANPGAVFEDFIRWHSPVDWETDEADIIRTSLESEIGPSRNNWPPRGRLSKRMSEQGDSWRQIWNDSPSLPASLQKPILDPIREGEKVLHYLETLRPRLLLEQIICTAFRVSLDTLNQTSFGNLKHMKTKIGQLYQTVALNLKPFRGTNLPEKAELVGDLRRLCVVFGHIENLVIFAASVHRKLINTPRLSEAIFNDYFNFYLPRMGSGSESICYDKEFVSSQKVNNNERERFTSLFPPPTANQSWRKVLNMGNLLNGHEPVLREIVFSVCDQVGSGRYETRAALGTDTHRMYACGTSNDLEVALSVISWD